jgi:hypothetical protein
LTSKQKQRIKEIKEEKPKEPIQKIIDTVRNKKEKTVIIKTEIASDTYARVESYKNKEKVKSVELATSELIEDGLDYNKIE